MHENFYSKHDAVAAFFAGVFIVIFLITAILALYKESRKFQTPTIDKPSQNEIYYPYILFYSIIQ